MRGSEGEKTRPPAVGVSAPFAKGRGRNTTILPSIPSGVNSGPAQAVAGAGPLGVSAPRRVLVIPRQARWGTRGWNPSPSSTFDDEHGPFLGVESVVYFTPGVNSRNAGSKPGSIATKSIMRTTARAMNE